MKHVIILLFALQFAFAQKNIHSKQLTTDEQSALKLYFQESYGVNLNSSYTLIHYVQPQQYCHYNKYEADPEKSAIWFEKLYKDKNIIFPASTKKLFSYYDEKYAAKWKGSHFVFDKGHVLHKLIMSIKKIETCEALLMFSPNGKVIVKYGETSPDDFKYITKEITKS